MEHEYLFVSDNESWAIYRCTNCKLTIARLRNTVVNKEAHIETYGGEQLYYHNNKSGWSPEEVPESCASRMTKFIMD